MIDKDPRVVDEPNWDSLPPQVASQPSVVLLPQVELTSLTIHLRQLFEERLSAEIDLINHMNSVFPQVELTSLTIHLRHLFEERLSAEIDLINHMNSVQGGEEVARRFTHTCAGVREHTLRARVLKETLT